MTAIRLKPDGYRELIQNKLLLEIIEEIISFYPPTLVNLERIRNRVDNLEEMFWIKDNEGKYLLVNKKFAACLGISPIQIEGKPVESFIPAYLLGFNKALESYIKESRNTFVIEGFPLSGLPASENYQTIEIPVAGPEGNITAVICVSQKVQSSAIREQSLHSFELLESLHLPFIYVNENGIIKAISKDFCDYYSLNQSNLISSLYSNTLPEFITKQIKGFLEAEKDYLKIDVVTGKENENRDLLQFTRMKKLPEKGIMLLVDRKKINEINGAVNESSEIINSLIQNNPEPVFIYDKENLHFLYANNAALALYRYRKDEFLQLDLTDLYSPEDIQTLLDAEESKSKEGVFSKPYYHKRKDGSPVFVELSKHSTKYSGKEAFFVVVRDITDKLIFERESQQFKATLENMSDLLFVTDKEGFIKQVNHPVIELLGYSFRNLEETSFTSLVADDDRGKINSSIFQAGIKERISHKTFLKKAGNEKVNVELIFIPIFNYKGEVNYYNIIAKVEAEKVKETANTFKAVYEMPEKFSESSVPETAFLTGVFHEILTPINVILGFVEELTGNIDNPSDEQKEAIEIINQNRANLLNSMNSAIEFNKLIKNRFAVKPVGTKITEIVEEASKEIKDTSSGIELAYGKISSSLQVVTDKEKFKLLITTLLKIASKISGEKKIYFSALPKDGNFIISFKDKFPAVSEKLLNGLNKFFSQEELLKYHEHTISLFNIKLSKNLLDMLGGKFKTLEEKGELDAVFVFPLEIETAAKKEIQLFKEKEVEIPEEIHETGETLSEEKHIEAPQSFIDLSQLSCLYIEDQPDSQTLFAFQMKDLKEIKSAAGFDQALPLLKDNVFDFLVVDINLAGDYNGLDILKIIRRMPEYENVPVIAVSAYLLPGDTERFIEAGFSDFLSKPVFREKLLSSLEKLFMPQA